ncbi:hypothetical protein MC885_005597 [Smutsia gigantea]|nr:hypothetical protein MC885_005597 [Smutsia gigantea]
MKKKPSPLSWIKQKQKLSLSSWLKGFWKSKNEELLDKMRKAEEEYKLKEEEISNLKAAFENNINTGRTLKTQAVNKLAEIMNWKDLKIDRKKTNTQDLRKKERENRKLQLELNQESEKFN